MGYITRNELSPTLRAELDAVYDYIQGSINEAIGAHMSDKNNPHEVTKAQVGLGNVINVRQATQEDFESHINDKSNPHEVTAEQVGAVPTSRNIVTSHGITGGGSLMRDLELRINTAYLDELYLRKTAKAVDSDKLDGYDSSAFFLLGSNYLRMANDDGFVYDDTNNVMYVRMDSRDFSLYHSGNLYHGMAPPSGGKNGDIYIQYG